MISKFIYVNTVSLAFVNYFANLVESLDVPILKETGQSRNKFCPYHWKLMKWIQAYWMHQKCWEILCINIRTKKQIFDIQEEHIDEERDKLNSTFSSFPKSFKTDIFLFEAALISILVTLVVIYMVCSHSKLRTLVANIALQHLKGIEATDPRYQYM